VAGRSPGPRRAVVALAAAVALTGCAGGLARRSSWDPDRPVVPDLPAPGATNAEAAGGAAPPAPASAPAAAPAEAAEATRLRNYVVLLPDEEGRVGAIAVTTPEGSRTLDRAWQAVDLDDPARPAEVGAEGIAALGAAALAVEPAAPARFVVYFDLAAVRPTAESEAGWPAVAAAVAGRAVPEVRLTGHADRLGGEAANEALALARAQAIRDRLVAAGVDPAWIETLSAGEASPAVPTPDGVPEPRNRRVEIRVR
jgi:outer membrane protein OmpA-like peptidoglycan-associated protein